MKYYCNPINIEYKYQFHLHEKFGEEFRIFREAADPSVIMYEGRYYMFVSMSLGVYVSEDRINWEYFPLPEELPLYDYAPDARVIGGYVYICASRDKENCSFYRTKNILEGPYEQIGGGFPFWDPNLFEDEDGRIYFYWGSSNVTPIWGVEMNPVTMEPVGEKVALITNRQDELGYERFGEDHICPYTKEQMESGYTNNPYNEGAWMTKYRGKYYLQYGTPGTEFNVYGDGVYVSDNPLGPFQAAKNNPYSYMPGGFMTGAGHGSTYRDTFGNWWHASTNQISINNNYERRIGIWKAGFDEDGELFCDQRYGDWPVAVPEKGVVKPFQPPRWFILSYGKKATASSFAENRNPENAVDENSKTFWTAKTGESGQWIQIDLGKVMDVRAIQLNFMDDECSRYLPKGMEIACGMERYIDGRRQKLNWILECSGDGKEFHRLKDRSKSDRDFPHDFMVWENGIHTRYLRLTVLDMPFGQPACISGFRVFGMENGKKPEKVSLKIKRKSDLDMQLTFHSEGALGYNILWGYAPDKLYHSCLTYKTQQNIGALIKGEPCYVRVDAFNESGITDGNVVKVCECESI